jgi:hypothetical protein
MLVSPSDLAWRNSIALYTHGKASPSKIIFGIQEYRI